MSSQLPLFELPPVTGSASGATLPFADAADLAVLPVCTQGLAVLYEDADLVVVNKPTRLLSVPGRHPANFDSVQTRLSAHYGPLFLAHRLDFDTSGLLAVPRTKRALSHLSQQFQARSVDKTYVALVAGQLLPEAGRIDLPIARAEGPRYKICHTSGKPSQTDYQVLVYDSEADCTRVALHPITGRTHQLRLHLLALGHPILGCEFYGDRAAAPRLCLHAMQLAFDHPSRAERLVFVQAPDF